MLTILVYSVVLMHQYAARRGGWGRGSVVEVSGIYCKMLN